MTTTDDPDYCTPGCADDVCRSMGQCAWPKPELAEVVKMKPVVNTDNRWPPEDFEG